MFGEDFWARAIINLPVILFSLTVHEYFHAWSAYKFGDPTAARMGRLTLNPIKHIDIMGLIVMVASGFRFGWAKPVPVNPMNLGNPRRDDIWISAAGPISNMAIAFIAGMLFRIVVGMSLAVPQALYQMLSAFVVINLALCFFNLIPLFPLDGSHILRNLLPPRHEETFARIDRVAPFILLILIITGSLWIIIGPFVIAFRSLFMGL